MPSRRNRTPATCYSSPMEERSNPNSANLVVSLKDALDRANDFYARGNVDKARALFEIILANQPRIPQAHNKLGIIYRRLGRYEDALAQYQLAIDADPNFATAYNNKSVILNAFMQREQAEQACRKSLEIRPGNARAWTNLGNILRNADRNEEAIACLRKAIELDPSSASAWRDIAAVITFTSLEQEEARAILKRVEGLSAVDPSYTHLHFALGKIYADCGEYGKSFEHYRRANDAHKANNPYRPEQVESTLKRNAGFFNQLLFKNNPEFRGTDDNTPIFIVGMPRSGKTLLESLLTRHPSIHGAGELHVIRDMVNALATHPTPYPACLAGFPQADVAKLSARYLLRARAYAPEGTVYIVDTMPTNFLHLGLIHLLLPNAKIIHCRRNALDSCLYSYFKYFDIGNEYSYDLKSLAHYYRHYQALMDHWQSALPKPILTVDYESLVRDTQSTLDRVTGFLSIDSVTPDVTLHDSEIDIWKHYEPYIESLMGVVH